MLQYPHSSRHSPDRMGQRIHRCTAQGIEDQDPAVLLNVGQANNFPTLFADRCYQVLGQDLLVVLLV